jgi:hypothetical protein
LTITSTQIISTVFWNSGSVQDFIYNFVDFPTVSDLLNVLSLQRPDYNISMVSELWSRNSEKYVIFNNDQFEIIIGSHPLQTKLFHFTNGLSYSNSSPSGIVSAGDTMVFSLNSETSKTITIPANTNTTNGPNTANTIQNLVRVINADNIENQPAYTNFSCVYQNGLYYLASGTAGTGSSVNVLGGQILSKLKLVNATAGTGDAVNNYFVTLSEVLSKLSSLTNIIVSNDNGFIKLSSNESIVITQTDLVTRLGFYTDNLQANPAIELTTVKNSSLRPITNISIQSQVFPVVVDMAGFDLLDISGQFILQIDDIVRISSTNTLPTPLLPNGPPIIYTDSGFGAHTLTRIPYSVKRGYEDRGDIETTFSITDDSLINSRRSAADVRKNTISNRLLQIPIRVTQIQTTLSQALYLDRWNEVQKRLNKKSGSYYAVGQKMLGIVRSQQQITDNNTTVSNIEAML